ncbi:MAG: hypothetical protein AAF281_14680, partial [Pseudomonadota bacterium]
PAPTPGIPADLLAAVDAQIQRGCSGPGDRRAGWLAAGDLDRDGVLDPVLDWAAIRCLAPPARPFCGASHCSVDLFLSRSVRAGRAPETILAIGVDLVPAPGGADLMAGVGIGECQSARLGPDCRMRWRWNGFEMAPQR